MLEYSREFIELAMRLNYTTAAEQLHLSTSALSRHIADLESELGFPLFNRTPLSLTQAGQYYLESISAIIDELDEVVAHGRKISEHFSKPFRVYMLPSPTWYMRLPLGCDAIMRGFPLTFAWTIGSSPPKRPCLTVAEKNAKPRNWTKAQFDLLAA